MILWKNKDICSAEKLEAATKKIKEYNTTVEIANVQLNNKNIPFDELLNQKAFDIERCLELDDTLVDQDAFANHKHDSP